jgi:hypothetical protein
VSGASQIPFGRVLITKATYPKASTPLVGINEISSVSLPTGSADIEVGFCIASHAIPRLGPDHAATSGVRGGDLLAALNIGAIWTQAEVPIARGDTLYYRNAADGAFNQLGVLAKAAGTGKTTFTKLAVTPDDDSTTLTDGTIIVPVSVYRIA